MKYKTECAKLTVSVSELADIAFPHGDLSDGKGQKSGRTASEKVRERIARASDGAYAPFVSLSHTLLYDGICYEVTGVADGVIRTPDGAVTLDEVHSVSSAGSADGSPVLFSKLKILAYFLCESSGLETVGVRLTYYITSTKRIKYFDQNFSRGELALFCSEAIGRASRFALFEKERACERYPSISESSFPYESVREGQREFISETYLAILHGRRLFAQAPTGTGKTMSALYPAAKALGTGACDRIFYLTAKTSTALAAKEAAMKLGEAGAKLRTVLLSSRESVCFLHGKGAGSCDPLTCEYAIGYRERAKEAIYELLSGGYICDRSAILAAAKKYRVCPHELSLDLSEYCDLIVCDYNYLFDPRVYLRRYFDFISERYVFLIDEAHNLADRARDMYSSVLSLSDFTGLLSMLSEDDKILHDVTNETANTFMAQKKLLSDSMKLDENAEEAGFYISREPLSELNGQLEKFTARCERWRYVYRDLDERFAPLKEKVAELFFAVREYLGILEYYDEHFITYIEQKQGDVRCKLFCLDPSRVLDLCMKRGISSILFSATLTPTGYFKDILGGGKRDRTLTLPFPYDKDNLLLAAVDSISTRYADRDATLSATADMIAAAVSGKKGNYIAYFPSYKYMNGVYSAFTAAHPEIKTAIQKGGKNRTDSAEFLSRFKAGNDEFFVGFCVLGGSFSEGIDLPGEQLIGAIVTGVGLPQISNEQNIIRDRYEKVYEAGYEYAYVYPGMNKILQATGRVIRREDDLGVVVLIDDRYASPEYIRLFPDHWSGIKYTSDARSLAALVKKFWKKNAEKSKNE